MKTAHINSRKDIGRLRKGVPIRVWEDIYYFVEMGRRGLVVSQPRRNPREILTILNYYLLGGYVYPTQYSRQINSFGERL